MPIRIVLVILAALLALPIAPIPSPPVEAKKRERTVTRTFRNPAAIDLPTSANSPDSAVLYPSPISVNGLKGRIRDVNLTLTDFRHDFPRDCYVLLVGPEGQTAIVMAHVGGFTTVEDVTLRLDDEAKEELPPSDPFQNGAFQPTNDDASPIAFNAPAPPVTSANAALSVFDGGNPNGTWRLFVQDSYGPEDPGAVAGGWELEITTKVKARKRR